MAVGQRLHQRCRLSEEPHLPARAGCWSVVADRFRLGNAEKARVIEAIEVALGRGSGRLNVYRLVDEDGEPELWRFSTGLHCPDSDLRYSGPSLRISRSTPPWGPRHYLPRLWPRDQVDGAVIPNEKAHICARRRIEGKPSRRRLAGAAGRPHAPRRGRRHSARHALVPAHGRRRSG